MMQSKLLFLAAASLLVSQASCGQKKASVSQSEVKEYISYLASDELRGRGTGDRGNDMAAQFIAGKFQDFGLSLLPEKNDFFQKVYLTESDPPTSARLKVGNLQFHQPDDLVVISGENTDLAADWVWSSYGLDTDERKAQNEILITKFGFPDESSLQKNLMRTEEKASLIQQKGVKALVELMDVNDATWLNIAGFLEQNGTHLNENPGAKSANFIHIIVHGNEQLFKHNNNPKAQIEIKGLQHLNIQSSNVLGMVKGTDPELQNEYLVLSAHFDHLGVGKPQKLDNGKLDSIYNGARDNAIGVAAILEAAKYFAKNPAPRSIIFIAFTAEELGLLGSRWYAENPLVPLNQTIFNLNIDGAGYNDTSLISIVGLNRTSAEKWISMACRQAGFKTGTDPTPGKFLFNASDNLNFAHQGVPCVTFSEGFTALDDDAIMKYYHQVTDEADNLDYDYLKRFCEVYISAAALIASDEKRPVWEKGDPYEEKAKMLYNN